MAIHCIIKGKVQGVWFRQSTLEQANELGITGWVKNNPDGDVELIACGEDNSLDALKRWLWQGPQLAEVNEVLIEDIPDQVFSHFFIQT